MKILERYVLKSFLAFFAASLFMVTMLFLVVSVLDSLNFLLIQQKAPLALIVRYYFYQVPQTTYMVIPMAALFSALITLGLMAQRSELVAIQAAGWSGFRLARPLFAASLLLSVLMFFFGDLVLPRANSEVRRIERRIKGKKELQAVRESRIWYVSERKHKPPQFYRIRHYDRDTQSLEGFQLYEMGEAFRLVRNVEAARGRYTGKGWEFEDVTVREFPVGAAPRISQASRQTLILKEKPADLEVVQLQPEEMSSWALGRQARLARNYGLDSTEYQVELQSRRSVPFSCLILMLLGVPLAIRSTRASSLAWNLFFAALTGFAYYIAIAEGLALGRGGVLTPEAAAWAGNLIFLAVAACLLWRANASIAPA
jgi:lipopolysaccharide export system permease protein